MPLSANELEKIREIEQLAFRSWPAKEIVPFGGWLLRSDSGVTRRANSVFPLNDPLVPLDEAIAYAIDFYTERGLIPRFQITKASMPSGLDEALAKTGFSFEMKTYVQTLDLSNVLPANENYLVELYHGPTQEWFSAYAKLTDYSAEVLKTRFGIFERMKDEKRFALVHEDDAVLGVSIGVLDNEWLGIHGVHTAKKHRRKGVATSINQALFTWAREKGGKIAYLQVEANNEPALALYSKIGFRWKYIYWYRQLV